jgi:mono/diheme cytochrome c family protein
MRHGWRNLAWLGAWAGGLILLGCERHADAPAPDAAGPDAEAGDRDGAAPSDAMPEGGAAAALEARIAALIAADTSPFQGELAPERRGEYLVRHVAGCAECHTPRDAADALDTSRWMAGVENLVDLDPDDPERGAIHAANLTPHPATGLGDWSDAEIKRAFLEGISKDGSALHPLMPYVVFHNMREADADAIVAYLRTLEPIEHRLPDRQPLDLEFAEPAAPIPAEAIPDPQLDAASAFFDSALRGKYLAGEIGMCMFCHTEEAEPGAPYVLRIDRLFAGRRKFYPFHFGQPIEPGTQTIESRNLTPHATGLAEWDATDVRTALKQGLNLDGFSLCAPMPVGPSGAFGQLTERDAIDIGHYLVHLEPQDSGPIEPCCTACHADTGTP